LSANYIRWDSLSEAKEGLKTLRKGNKTIGSIHTLGALHEGHGKVIELAAKENDFVIVSVYPNMAQLDPSIPYEYDHLEDCKLAAKHGATHIIVPSNEEMYPKSYRTFFDQGECYKKLDGEVAPNLFKGMITMSTRWIIFTKPDRSYWGLKDIAQTILVKRAVEDLLIDTKIVPVPCVRYKCGIAISSRLMNQPEEKIIEFSRVYSALEIGRKAISDGITDSKKIITIMKHHLNSEKMKYFKLKYIKLANPTDFIEHDIINVPIIIHIVLTDGQKNYFEGHFIKSEKDLIHGPETIWLDSQYPPFKIIG